jgi:hypothetical protein
MGKKPKAKAPPTAPEHQPRASGLDPGNYYDLHPAWRIGCVRMVDPYGWHEIDRETLRRVLLRLKSFESMRWREILLDAKKQHHTIPADKLSTSAQKCLEEDWQGADEVISLALTGKERIFGIMDRGAFTILWWDPEHAVCPSTYMDRRS